MRLIIAVKNPTEELTGHILFTLVVGYFACAQYDVKSPIGTSCHFAYAADAPLLSLSRHFPRFSGGIYPEGGSKVCFYCLCEQSEAISREGGGLQSIFSVLFRWDISHSLNMTKKKK